MGFPVSKSNVPLVFDALPALVVRHWQTPAGTPNIYTQARLYFSKDTLLLHLTAFEREPSPESRVAFALAGAGEAMLAAVLSPTSAVAYTCAGRPVPDLWRLSADAAPVPAQRFAGVDEQGWYWGAQLTLSPALLQQAGIVAENGASFFGQLLKYGAAPPDVGTSFALAHDSLPLDIASMGSFTVFDA